MSSPGLKVVCSYCGLFIREEACSWAPAEQVSHGVCENCLPKLLSDLGQSMDEFLDSLAAPVVWVQADGQVRAANHAAQVLVGKPLSQVTGSRPGAVIGCTHAREPGGCGQTMHCQSCTIRHSVRLTHDTGQPCDRVPAYADLGTLTGVRRTAFLISTRKVADLVLLTIHEVTPMSDAGPVG